MIEEHEDAADDQRDQRNGEQADVGVALHRRLVRLVVFIPAAAACHECSLFDHQNRVADFRHVVQAGLGNRHRRREAARREERSRACLITFDDGLAEQFDTAREVLRRLDVPAMFFVAGMPLQEGRPLGVHLIHALREVVPDEQLLELLVEEGAGKSSPLSSLEAKAQEMYRYDVGVAPLVKYLLNVVLDATERDAIVDRLFREHCEDPAEFASRLYMTADQVVALERESSLGAHGYAHLPLAQLAPADIRSDLGRGANVLRGLTGACPEVVSYPYGSRATVDSAVAEAATAEGFEVGLTMERAFNASAPRSTPTRASRLPRCSRWASAPLLGTGRRDCRQRRDGHRA